MNIDLCCEKVAEVLKKAKTKKATIDKVLLTLKEFNDAESTSLPRNEKDYILRIGPKKKDPKYRSIGATTNGDKETSLRSGKDS